MKHSSWHSAVMLSVLVSTALAVPSIFEPVRQGVYVVRDDAGQWGGDLGNSITHQVSPSYLARKTLDLSDVPLEIWEQTRQVYLSAYFMVRDYSWHDNPPTNGLDEAFEIIINGHPMRFATNCGAPVFNEGGAPSIDWYDISVPKDYFVLGPNEVIIHKASGEKYDDYLYLGIDNSVRRGNSAVAFDATDWTQKMLTVPGGNGEYMVRLYLLTGETRMRAAWRPGAEPDRQDPAGLILYVGSRDATPAQSGLSLVGGASARMEWDPRVYDRQQTVTVIADGSGEGELTWLDESDKPRDPVTGALPLLLELPAGAQWRASGVQLTGAGVGAVLEQLAVEVSMSLHPPAPPIDMCPRIASPRGGEGAIAPFCRVGDDRIELGGPGMQCAFSRGDRLQLTSLYNRFTDCEMVIDPGASALFVVEVEGKRYAGSRDFQCVTVTPQGEAGFVAELELAQPVLRATLAVSMETEGLRLGLELTNAGETLVDFKLAFPHLAGLTASGHPESDYYFFPWGGGIIADRPAIIRRGYGDNEALYQVMDLFSPERGGGLSVRTDDAEGWHKTLALRKFIPGRGSEDVQKSNPPTSAEYKWSNPLDPVPGTSFAYEYLRRTRGPGAGFRPADAVLSAHPGDWRVAMRAYADWAHGVWRFRPYPSRLRSVRHMIPVGWADDFLFRDGKYRTDFIRPDTDCVELMSWWDWSPLGPWSTPFDRLHEVLSEDAIRMWQPYFVKDPVTGQTMWNDQPGDYSGYNERFGGLPAFQEAVRTYQRMGVLVTLYTDPFRLDDNCPTGRAHGKEWGVVLPDGQHSKNFDVWNPCHDTPAVRQWVAETMGRVTRETGADGIRLDEYGHSGWACFSDLHPHTYAERGVTQWQKGVAETTRLVHEAMDAVRPGLVLTTEHAGYDYLMQYLEGCITYDVTIQACSLRPLECNLQRFYFPECKAYELDHMGADPQDLKKLWNAVESFGRYFPPEVYTLFSENEDVYQSRDCEPLIPTLIPRLYANRFSGGGKTMFHLYNATGHTVDGPALAVELSKDQHLFEPLACRDCPVVATADGLAARVYMPRKSVLVLGVLPRLLAVDREGTRLTVRVPTPEPDSVLVLATADGSRLLSVPAKEGENIMDLSELPRQGAPACIKLLRGRDLQDAIPLP